VSLVIPTALENSQADDRRAIMSPHIKKDDEKVFPYWQLTVLGEFFKPARERRSHGRRDGTGC
jgi:hypothetical protein